jgi:hypothetical protein
VIAEELGIAHVAAQRVHTPMAALVHHFEDRGAAPAADVRKPDRSEWPAKSFGSSPTRRSLALTTLTTV